MCSDNGKDRQKSEWIKNKCNINHVRLALLTILPDHYLFASRTFPGQSLKIRHFRTPKFVIELNPSLSVRRVNVTGSVTSLPLWTPILTTAVLSLSTQSTAL